MHGTNVQKTHTHNICFIFSLETFLFWINSLENGIRINKIYKPTLLPYRGHAAKPLLLYRELSDILCKIFCYSGLFCLLLIGMEYDNRTWSRSRTHTPLEERSARRRDLYLTIHNNRKRLTSIPPRQESNPQSQQARSREITTRQPRTALCSNYVTKNA